MDLTLKSNDHALYPLLHFVLDDLPTSTKAPDLDHSNTLWACQEEIRHAGWNGLTLACPNVKDLLPLYLGYFVHVGFLNAPISNKHLVQLTEWQSLKKEINSRTGN
jgi:L-aminoadipate-semialdehyde dehydrogenase